MSERLKDDDALWGKTRMQHAFEHVKRRREAERRRRQSFRAGLTARRNANAVIFVPMERISAAGDDEWHLRIRRGLKDTRDLTGRLMGDPRPGRSALDIRRKAL